MAFIQDMSPPDVGVNMPDEDDDVVADAQPTSVASESESRGTAAKADVLVRFGDVISIPVAMRGG
jgi:hypothetical protein